MKNYVFAANDINVVPLVQLKKREKHPWRSVALLACSFTKINTPPCVFSRFLNCTNGTKSRKTSQMHYMR